MKKIIFWLGLGLIVVLIICCALNVFYCDDPQNRDKRLELWLIGFGSIGSLGAVVTALYLEPIKKFFYKPNLNLFVSNLSPLCIIGNVDAGAAGNEEFIDICGKVWNAGGSTAEKCRIVCEEILTPGADMKYSVSDDNRFRPLFFSWIGVGEKQIEMDIAVSDCGFFKLAEIRTRSSELGKAPDVGYASEISTPYLVVCLPNRTFKNQFIQFYDDKSVIVHFRIASVGLTAKERYVQIVWGGKSIEDFKTHPEKLAITDVTSQIESLRRQQ